MSRYLNPATKWILITNVGVFLFQYIILQILGLREQFTLLFCQIPYFAVQKLQVWRFVTYMFLHGGGMHLLFNMLALFFFAGRLEARWGIKGFLKFYFICGIGAAIVHAIFTYLFGKPVLYNGELIRGFQPMLGASGAIYGILLAFAFYWPDQKVLLYFFIPIKIKYLVVIFGVLEFMGTVGAAGSNISHITHLGGLLTAFLYLRGWNKVSNLFGGRGGFRGGGRGRRVVKRYYRDSDGKIYVEFDEE